MLRGLVAGNLSVQPQAVGRLSVGLAEAHASSGKIATAGILDAKTELCAIQCGWAAHSIPNTTGRAAVKFNEAYPLRRALAH